jgi:hypothetical protein
VLAGDPVSYETDIRPLFRERDRSAMSFAFDLYSYDDVKGSSDAILGQLESGSMPCDAPWPDQQVELFRAWVDQGCAP